MGSIYSLIGPPNGVTPILAARQSFCLMKHSWCPPPAAVIQGIHRYTAQGGFPRPKRELTKETHKTWHMPVDDKIGFRGMRRSWTMDCFPESKPPIRVSRRRYEHTHTHTRSQLLHQSPQTSHLLPGWYSVFFGLDLEDQFELEGSES